MFVPQSQWMLHAGSVWLENVDIQCVQPVGNQCMAVNKKRVMQWKFPASITTTTPSNDSTGDSAPSCGHFNSSSSSNVNASWRLHHATH